MIKTIIKRDGRRVPYEISKIQDAILMAATVVNDNVKENIKIAEETAKVVDEKLHEKFHARKSPTVEQIQDYVEKALISEGHAIVAKEYILYRAERNRTREMKADLMKVFEDLTFTDARDSDIKRENGNIDANTAMGTMLKYGSEGAKEFNHLYLLDRDVSEAHKSGDIHIHDLDFYALTETCATRDTKIILKIGNRVFNSTFAFFDKFFNTKLKERININQINILSADGKFVPIVSCERRPLNADERVFTLETTLGDLHLTANHHVPIIRKGKEILLQVKDLQVGDKLIRGSAYKGNLFELNTLDYFTPDDDFVIVNSDYLRNVAHQYHFIEKLYRILNIPKHYKYSKRFTFAEYKRVRHLFEGLIDEHNLIADIKQGKSGGFPLILPLTKELGKIMGYIYSEGHVRFEKEDKRVFFTNSDSLLLNDYKYCLSTIFPHLYYREKSKADNRAIDIIVNSGYFAYLFNGPLGFKKSSFDITMPEWIYDANPEFIKGFIGALIDGDGTVAKDYDIVSYTTSCKKFRDSLHHLLLIKGIDSLKGLYHLKDTKYNIQGKKGTRNGDSYNIRICASNADKLKDFYSFKVHKNYQEKERFLGKTENLTNIKDIYYRDYSSFVYDIETGDHYFNANGYLIHNCLQIPLDKLFDGGFSTGHGYLREPESIRSYAALTAIALQCNQNEMHGGQSIPALDYYLAPGVGKSYVSEICKVLENRFDIEDFEKDELKSVLREKLKENNYHLISDSGKEVIKSVLSPKGYNDEDIDKVLAKALKHTEKETYQAMEALVHNLNSMHSRAGAQVNNVA